MNELRDKGSTQRLLQRKSSESFVKFPLEPQVQKMIKSDGAHYLHSPVPPFSQVSLLSCGIKCTLFNLAFRSLV